MALLNGEQILAADDSTFEDVDVPEWGGAVRVRVLGALERRDFEKRYGQLKDNPDVDERTLLVGACLVGEDGKPLFTADQLKALAQKSNVPIIRLLAVCQRLNRIGDWEEAAAKK